MVSCSLVLQIMILLTTDARAAHAYAGFTADCPATEPELPWELSVYDETLRLFTSGTTGRQKSVCLTSINEVLSAHDVMIHFPFSFTDRSMNTTPWFHRGGLHSGGITPTLYAGGTVIIQRKFQPEKTLDMVQQYGLTFLIGVPNVLELLAEAQQILGIQDALAKCNVNYDAVEDCWAITTPHDDSIDKRKTCGIGPNLYIWDKGNTIVFWEDFTYMGSSELDIDDIILRGGDYKYTYICDYDNSGYGYDKELGKWFAWATFEMEDSEVEWLRNLLSADTVIMRFEGTDYSKFDYTWTVQDRQAITDIIDLYNLLKAVTPEVREKALRN